MSKRDELRRLIHLMSRDHLGITVPELVEKSKMSKVEVHKTLKLHRIACGSGIMGMIESGEICAANAFCLAALPPEKQSAFVGRAITMVSDRHVTFADLVKKELKRG